jgi:hypothetical protein
MSRAETVNVKVAIIRPIGYRDLKSWCEDPENEYVGRKGVVFITDTQGQKSRYPKKDSKWANPFKISKTQTREDVLELYKKYIISRLEDPKDQEITYEELKKLRGKKLGCWCAPEDCHADILVTLSSKKY